MKRVILVRHATPAGPTAAVSDLKRPLLEQGRLESRRLAGWCVAYLDPPDLLLSSPARRAVETARVFADVLGHHQRVATERRLYDARAPRDVLDVIHGLDDASDCVMVFGHDPVSTEFAAAMAPPFDQPVPKCGVVVIDTRRRKWKTLRPGDGTVYAFQHPRALEAARGK